MVIIVQVLGKYMIIRYLDTQGKLDASGSGFTKVHIVSAPLFNITALGSQCSDSCHIQYRAEATNVLLRGFKDLHDMWAQGIVGIV